MKSTLDSLDIALLASGLIVSVVIGEGETVCELDGWIVGASPKTEVELMEYVEVG